MTLIQFRIPEYKQEMFFMLRIVLDKDLKFLSETSALISRSPTESQRLESAADLQMGKREDLVGFEVLTAVVMKSNIFWDITPCSPLQVNRHFGGTYRLHLFCLPSAFTLVSCSAYSSTLKIEAICSSETSVHFHRTIRRYVLEDSNVQERILAFLFSYSLPISSTLT
jgi:hypothetical protein